VNDPNDDQIGRVLTFFMARKPRNGRADCPDEETRANYLKTWRSIWPNVRLVSMSYLRLIAQ
jgi:hypothetical protein